MVQWHQDYSYWDRTGPMAHLTVHIALDDQTADNGALLHGARARWLLCHAWAIHVPGLCHACAVHMPTCHAHAHALPGALHWVPGSHRWTRGGGPLPQAAAIAREKMARARATGEGADLAAPSFDTAMNALYDAVLTDEEREQWSARPPETVRAQPGQG